MKYTDIDKSGHPYFKIPLGWDDPEAYLRVTMIEGDAGKESTVRLNKEQDNKIFPGPEIETRHIPKLTEGLLMVFNSLEENMH